MPTIIKDGQLVEDHWQLLADEQVVSAGQWLLPLARWQVQREQLRGRRDIGVYLGPEDEAESLAEDIDQLALIAIEFPVFMDGRGFSNAAILRQQFNYRGELRAVGGFIRDQLCYLSRCGFNAFDLGGEDLEAALHSLQDLNEFYQASSDQPKPLFRRR